ncbi:hypothetical protein [Streptomyces sp. NPDC094144]|uniref:hypothetical protein n=1 Tax=Streptomyces sp. NPDC094144 TaxID=3366056 RepID=UPI0038110F82
MRNHRAYGGDSKGLLRLINGARKAGIVLPEDDVKWSDEIGWNIDGMAADDWLERMTGE